MSYSPNQRESFIALTSPYTLTSQTALQQLFNAPANGAFNAEANTSYFFECGFDLTGLSATSGDVRFGLLGSAGFSSVSYRSVGHKQAPTATTTMASSAVATATSVVGASTATASRVIISGIIRVSTAGTIVPAVGMSIAAAAIVSTDSFFRIRKIGSGTVQSVGDWS